MLKEKLLLLLVVMFAIATNINAQNPVFKNYSGIKMFSQNVKPTPMETKLQLGENEFWWGYFDGDMSSLNCTGPAETMREGGHYDACIMLSANDARVSGMTIKGFKVLFSKPTVPNVGNVKVWVSKNIRKDMSDAEIITMKEISKEELASVNEIRFDTPYTIESEDVYVGYSFDLEKIQTDADRMPFVVTVGMTEANAFILNLDYGGFMDIAGIDWGNLAVQVLLEGNFLEDGATLSQYFYDTGVQRGATTNIPLQIQNAGTNPLKSFSYTVTVDGVKSEEKDVTLNKPLKKFGDAMYYEFPVQGPEKTGKLNCEIELTKVNGLPNLAKSTKAVGRIINLAKIAKRKVVLEEFTGTWCSNCPWGFVGLERAHQMFGDDVVMVAAHSNDPMECPDYAPILMNETEFPSVNMNRAYFKMHPYVGSNLNPQEDKFYMGDDIARGLSVAPFASVSATGIISDDKNTVEATCNTEFMFDTTKDAYSVAFVITEDGMTGKGGQWLQSNNLTGDDVLVNIDPLFKRWVEGKGKMAVEFDHVAVAAQGIEMGVENSFAADPKEGEVNKTSVKFNLGNYPIIQDKDRLNLCVFLIEKETGRIINADCQPIKTLAGIENVNGDSEFEEVARYTIDGTKIEAPAKGINIVKYSDGTIRKVVVR